MSFINNLIRWARAEPRPHELVIPLNRVGTLVEHCRALTWPPIDAERIYSQLLDGQIWFYGIRLRVTASWPFKTFKPVKVKGVMMQTILHVPTGKKMRFVPGTMSCAAAIDIFRRKLAAADTGVKGDR